MVTVLVANGKVQRLERRDAVRAVAQQVGEFPCEGEHAAQRVPQAAIHVVLLTLDEYPGAAIAGQLQLTAGHAAPAAAALVGCFEPADIKRPDGIEAVEPIGAQNRQPVFGYIVFHGCGEQGPALRAITTGPRDIRT